MWEVISSRLFKHLYLMHSSDRNAVNLCVALCSLPTETKRNALNEPDVPFPPAAPTVDNLDAICNLSQGRPRYPSSFFPNSRFGHFRRRGNAINRLEWWYSLCCSGEVAEQRDPILCCTKQAVSFCLCLCLGSNILQHYL